MKITLGMIVSLRYLRIQWKNLLIIAGLSVAFGLLNIVSNIDLDGMLLGVVF